MYIVYIAPEKKNEKKNSNVQNILPPLSALSTLQSQKLPKVANTKPQKTYSLYEQCLVLDLSSSISSSGTLSSGLLRRVYPLISRHDITVFLPFSSRSISLSLRASLVSFRSSSTGSSFSDILLLVPHLLPSYYPPPPPVHTPPPRGAYPIILIPCVQFIPLATLQLSPSPQLRSSLQIPVPPPASLLPIATIPFPFIIFSSLFSCFLLTVLFYLVTTLVYSILLFYSSHFPLHRPPYTPFRLDIFSLPLPKLLFRRVRLHDCF